MDCLPSCLLPTASIQVLDDCVLLVRCHCAIYFPLLRFCWYLLYLLPLASSKSMIVHLLLLLVLHKDQKIRSQMVLSFSTFNFFAYDFSMFSALKTYMCKTLLKSYQENWGTRRVAQAIEHLPSKHSALN
jgi:hypothetical protein